MKIVMMQGEEAVHLLHRQHQEQVGQGLQDHQGQGGDRKVSFANLTLRLEYALNERFFIKLEPTKSKVIVFHLILCFLLLMLLHCCKLIN
jgi:hypothetical protein